MRNLLISAAFLAVTNGVYAQQSEDVIVTEESTDKYRVETNRFWSNWFITAGGGVQMYFGDHNRQMSVGKQLSPALDVSVGKWFTPGIGVRLMYSGLSIKGATQNGAHSTGKVYDASQKLDYQEFDYANIHGDVMFNLSNLFCGYNPDRIYTITPYVGLGWMQTWDGPKQHEVSANVGLLNTFRLSPALDLNLDIRGAMVNDRFDGEIGGRKQEGLLSATLGLTYKFKQRGWKKSRTTTITYYNEAELNEMRAKFNESQESLRESQDENIRLKDQLAGMSSDVETKIVLPQQAIFFALGKSDLNKESRVNLGFLAKVILESKVKSYVITGYADRQTGTSTINETLSRSRAQAVYDYLVNECGVPSSILQIKQKGGVDNMFFNDAALSRVVITEATE